MRRGLADYQSTGAGLWVPDFLALLADAHRHAGRPAAGLECLAEAMGRMERTGGRWFEAELHRLEGELKLASGDSEGAASCFRRAMAFGRERGARMWELRAAVSLARLRQAEGRRAEAHHLLAPVYGRFAEGFDRPDLVEAKRLIDELTGGPGARLGPENRA
jgi:predicted ATPase